MRYERTPAFHTRRDAWVEIDLAGFEYNVSQIQKNLPNDIGLMAVIKADAYGHGAPMLVPILESIGVQMLGVASVDEALQLKTTKTQLPILILGPSPEWALPQASQEGFEVTVFSYEHIEVLKAHYEQTGQKTKVQIKVDTGMHRIGIAPELAPEFLAYCQAQPYLDVTGIFSHLAVAGQPEFQDKQYQVWKEVLSNIQNKPQWVHIASSAAVDGFNPELGNLVRVGLSLFGYGDYAKAHQLKPLMQLKGRITHIQQLQPQQGVSYGFSYINKSDRPQVIASLPLGYADGLPRGLSNKVDFHVQGVTCPQVGTICMDQCLVDVTGAYEPKVGDVVTLLGDGVWLDNWAKVLNTIEYELMCGLRVRLPRTFVRL